MEVYAMTMCFCRSNLLKYSLPYFKSLMTYPIARYFISLNHWPIDEVKNNAELSEIAKAYGCEIFDQQIDRGLHKAFNNWFSQVSLAEDSILIGLDPDTGISHEGFDSAIVDVMTHDKDIKICGLWNLGTELKYRQGILHPQEKVTSNGVRYFIHPGIEMFDTVGWRVSWLRAIGGVGQPNEYYGGLESWLHTKPGFKLAYLLDYQQSPGPYPVEECFEPKYRQWKDAHLSGFSGSFGEWLRVNKHI